MKKAPISAENTDQGRKSNTAKAVSDLQTHYPASGCGITIPLEPTSRFLTNIQAATTTVLPKR
jgi:hypothetical protein